MKFSKFISIILHPIFMPLLALCLSLAFVPEIKFAIRQNLTIIFVIVIISTVFLPLISILFLVKNGRLSSLEMTDHRERILPLFKTVFWMSLGYFFLQNYLIYAALLKAELLGAIFIIVIAAAISRFWKISLHMLGIGGVLGVVISLQILYKNMNNLIVLFVFLSGVLAFARLNQKAHNHTQVYVGFLLGLTIEMLVLLNY